MASGGYTLDNTRGHRLARLHPGELVIPKRLVPAFREQLKSKNGFTPALRKDIQNLFRRRPHKITDKEFNSVIEKMAKDPSLRAKPRGCAKRSRPSGKKAATKRARK